MKPNFLDKKTTNDFELYKILKEIVTKNYKEDHNYETRIWSDGYTRAMRDIEEKIENYAKERGFINEK